MTSSLLPTLREKLALPEINESSISPHNKGYCLGRQDEHTRLAPIHQAMLSVIEAAERIESTDHVSAILALKMKIAALKKACGIDE